MVIGSGTATGTGATVIGNGTATGDYSVTLGMDTLAGCMGYYIAAIDPANNHIYLHTGENAVIPTWDNPSSFYDAAFESGYKILNNNNPTTTEIVSQTIDYDDLVWERCESSDDGADDEVPFFVTLDRAYIGIDNLTITSVSDGTFVPWDDSVSDDEYGGLWPASRDNTVSYHDGYIYIFSEASGYVPTMPSRGSVTFNTTVQIPAEDYNPYSNEFSVSSDGYYHWTFAGNMTAISGNRITYSSETLNTSEKWLSNVDNGADPCTFFIPVQPEVGLTNIGTGSVAEGWNTHAAGQHSHAEGYGSIVAGRYGHAEGNGTRASFAAHAEGISTSALGFQAHAEGKDTIASGATSHAEGGGTQAIGVYTHAEGHNTIAQGSFSHAEGKDVKSLGNISHAEGNTTTTFGKNSHAEGYGTTAGKEDGSSGDNSHAEGSQTKAYGGQSHAEGNLSEALGNSAHAEGYKTEASGKYSHAEGRETIASGERSHAEGSYTIASGEYSHAEGYQTKASSNTQHVQGKYNIEDTENKYAHIVGNGTKENKRSNAHTLDWDGNAWFAGDVESSAGKLATENYVDGKISQGDWEENDSNSSSYIKNRTHWIEDKVIYIQDELIHEGRAFANTPLEVGYIEFLDVNNGAIILAIIDGEEFYGTAERSEDTEYVYVSFNNGSVIIESYIKNYGRLKISSSLDHDVNIQIYTTKSEIEYIYHKLDKNYLPDEMATKEYVDGKTFDTSNLYITAGRLADSVVGNRSTAEGYMTTASNNDAHAEGNSTTASGLRAHAEGMSTVASGNNSHAEGQSTEASGSRAHAEGRNTVASNNCAHAEGYKSIAEGKYSHAEGLSSKASGESSHAEGEESVASGTSSHAEGYMTTASGAYSHTEGGNTTAKKSYSHAEGSDTTASGDSSHAEGCETNASGFASHAEGTGTQATGQDSHAEGARTEASGHYSHSEGYFTIASGEHQHVQGRYNIASHKYAHIVGNGSNTVRSNAHTLDWNGIGWFAKDVRVGSDNISLTQLAEAVYWLERAISEDAEIIKFTLEDRGECRAILGTTWGEYINRMNTTEMCNECGTKHNKYKIDDDGRICMYQSLCESCYYDLGDDILWLGNEDTHEEVFATDMIISGSRYAWGQW